LFEAEQEAEPPRSVCAASGEPTAATEEIIMLGHHKGTRLAALQWGTWPLVPPRTTSPRRATNRYFVGRAADLYSSPLPKRSDGDSGDRQFSFASKG
jgi:hypothetical protein